MASAQKTRKTQTTRINAENHFLRGALLFLKSFKEHYGLSSKAAAVPVMDPKKVLQKLQSTAQKLDEVEKERQRFRTQDVQDFEVWKRQALALKLEHLKEVEQHFNQLVQEYEEVMALLKPKKSPQHQNFGPEVDGDPFDNESEDHDDPEEWIDDQKKAQKFKEQDIFAEFYELTGWNEDILEQVARMRPKDRNLFVREFYDYFESDFPPCSFTTYRAFINEHIRLFLERQEEMELAQQTLEAGESLQPLEVQIKTIYRTLMKQMHPDLKQGAKELSEAEKDLFVKTQHAYKRTDLVTLQECALSFSLLQGRVDSSVPPRMLKKIYEEKTSLLNEARKELRRMKKNVEWNFSAKSSPEKNAIKRNLQTEIDNLILMRRMQSMALKDDLEQLQSHLRRASKAEAQTY